MLPPLYSRRKRMAASASIDVYEYSVIPEKVRIQVIQILGDGIGPYYFKGNIGRPTKTYGYLVKKMRRELGVHSLVTYPVNSRQEFFQWLQSTHDIDHWLDACELALKIIDIDVREKWGSFEAEVAPDIAIAEFNARLQEAAIGYQYVSGEILRIDSMHIHKEVVLLALGLLRNARFAAAESEYRSAHHAFRNGELEDCLVDCGKAFESVLKVIGTARGWTIKENDPASRLVQAAVDAGFLAAYSITALNHLKGLIDSSTPTVRNKQGGHGAGTTVRNVPTQLAAFQLHQTAAVILYLVEQDLALAAT